MTKFLPLPILIIALLAIAPAASAKGPKAPAANSPLVGALDACRQIPEAEQRLACFDRASAALVGATASGEVSVVDRKQLGQARKALFGFNMPRLPFFAGDKSAEDDKGVLDSTIKSVRTMGYERFQIVLADGAIWETAQVYLSFSEPRKGQKVHIKRAPLGVYFLEIDGQVAVKGRRVG
ncbi:MAG TPA: hypothetical protein VK485_07645 [Sphingomicrobium sp.]|nr:hypothetical protein [Sphingomicrobium sp.]